MTQDSPDVGEQALSKVAEIAITSQLDAVEAIEVDIRTNPLKLVQGEVDSVAIVGKGLVMQQDLRVDSLQVNTGTVSVNPLATVMGKIELTQAANADAQIVLTEADLNRAVSSDFLRQKMRGFELLVEGNRLTIDTQTAQIRLPGDNRIFIDAELKMRETGDVKHLVVEAKPTVRDRGQRISLEDIKFADGQGFSLEFATALFEKMMELLDLRNFELQGTSLRLNKLEMQKGQLQLNATANVEQLPSES